MGICKPTHFSTIDPTVNDDVTEGFGVKFYWLNTTSGALFVCEDNTNGAAVWTQVGGALAGNIRSGSIAVFAAGTNIVFSSTLGTTNYALTWFCYDTSGNPISCNIRNRVATGFRCLPARNGTLDYHAISHI